MVCEIENYYKKKKQEISGNTGWSQNVKMKTVPRNYKKDQTHVEYWKAALLA